MRFFATVLLSCVAATAVAGPDPIVACREAHAGNAAAHIACLENALRAVGAEPPGRPAPTGEAAPVAIAATAPQQPTGLGAEQAKARQRSDDARPEQVAARIVSVSYDSAGLGVFTMADGQIWRETVATPARHHLDRGREYAARIERGSIGGYRMYVEGVKWMHKVERLK